MMNFLARLWRRLTGGADLGYVANWRARHRGISAAADRQRAGGAR